MFVFVGVFHHFQLNFHELFVDFLSHVDNLLFVLVRLILKFDLSFALLLCQFNPNLLIVASGLDFDLTALSSASKNHSLLWTAIWLSASLTRLKLARSGRLIQLARFDRLDRP